MNMKSMNNTDIRNAFSQLFNQLTEKEILENEAKIIMFRFLSIVDEKRLELGWSRKDLAEKIGTSPAFVSQLFNGDKLINMTILATIQKVMGFEFEITEKRSFKGKMLPYTPEYDGSTDWVWATLKGVKTCNDCFPMAI